MNYISKINEKLNIIKNNYKMLSKNEQNDILFALGGVGLGLLLFTGAVIVTAYFMLRLPGDGAGNRYCGDAVVKYNEEYYYFRKTDGILMSSDKDGKNIKSLNNINSGENLVFWEDSLYYIGGNENRGIYKTNLITGKTELLIKGLIKKLDVKNGVMVFTSDKEDGRVFQADSRGKFRRPVTSARAESFFFDGRYIYYSNKGGISRYDTRDKSEYIINSSEHGRCINEYKDTLFYYNEALKVINRLDKKSGEAVCAVKCEGEVNFINICQKSGMLFYCEDGVLKHINLKKPEISAKEYHINTPFCIYDGIGYYLSENKIESVDINES